MTSEWSSCELNCGSAIQTRETRCATKEGMIYPDERCQEGRKPILSQPCANYSGCDAIWFASQWSECSSSCGDGIRTRFAFCGMWDDDQIVTLTEEECKDIPKPNITQICENPECESNWYTGPSGMCSTKCDEGKSSKIVLCLNTEGAIDVKDCPDTENDLQPETACNQNVTCDDVEEVTQSTNGTENTTQISCEMSEFGCCPDWMTAREKDWSNCPPMDMDDKCDSTEFGCCQDGETAAFGPFQEGCVINCNDTVFGCCNSDMMTPANSTDQEGCPPDCVSSEFGCCSDNETAAPGKDGEGCDFILQMNECMKSEFGCCPDNQTMATGDNNQGCDVVEGRLATVRPGCANVEGDDEEGSGAGPMCNETIDIVELEDCSNSTFNCCMDGITPAKGENFTGCDDIAIECNGTKFGCCPDNETVAEGANGEGCGNCTNSEFGCCPDNKTVAEGPGGVGCDCDSLPFGCCPDGRSPAKGERFYGCTCHEYPHGCCQDNYTPARGEGFDGCICSRMLYGCCRDNITPATGPENQGCDCRRSPHGCCPDGVTAASGPRNHGCNCESMPYGCCSDQRTPASGNK